ncbi:MAG: GFA family protein [Boseongicola sp.]|nr:GFA family protein [Boseongicola sp.]MDD9976466.1 GFA family protein [Boseongicola sp.]
MSERRTGKCLCGAVSFEADVELGIQACHCSQCQRWTGGGPLFAARVRNMEMDGAEFAEAYLHSEWGERAVCKTCGSTLYWKMQGKNIAFMAAGLLDDQSGLKVTEEIFIDYRPDWMPAFEGANQSTEAELQAKLAAYLESQKS